MIGSIGSRRAIGMGIALLASGAMALAACGSGSNSSGGSSAYGAGPKMTTAAEARPMADISVTTNAKFGQSLLVDQHGMSIYLFVPDGTSTSSKVPAEFKPNWPPVTSKALPAAGAGLDSTKISEHTQSDGTRQLAYNGHLLYLYVGDDSPGDTNGQGLGNNWYLVSAAGNAVGQPTTTTSAPGTAP